MQAPSTPPKHLQPSPPALDAHALSTISEPGDRPTKQPASESAPPRPQRHDRHPGHGQSGHSRHLHHHDSTPLQEHLAHSHTAPSVLESPQEGTASYFTFPVTYAVNDLLRRLSGDTVIPDKNSHPSPSRNMRSASRSASQSRSSSQSNSVSNLKSLWSSTNTYISSHLGDSSLSTPTLQPAPKRTASPFQPPPLAPLSLTGYKSATSAGGKILSKNLAEEIRLLVPPRLQLVDTWKLIFGLEQDGVSLATLYDKCDQYRGRRGGFVVAVKDEVGGIFGAFLSDPPHPSSHFYGTGECFLWRSSIPSSASDLSNLPPPPSEDTTSMNSRMSTIQGSTRGDGTATPDRIRFKAFPYSGINDYLILCETSYVSVGGG